MKYEYKFKRIEMKRGFIENRPKQQYHSIITQYAEDGWRFVQIFAPATKGGSASYFELIFERTVD